MTRTSVNARRFFGIGSFAITLTLYLYGIPNLTNYQESQPKDLFDGLTVMQENEFIFINYVPANDKLNTVIRADLTEPLDNPIPIDEDGYKLILFHTRNYGEDFISDWPTKDGNYYYTDSLFDCPVKCKYSMNRSLGAEAHGVVFGILDDMYHTRRGEPRYPALPRRREQIWIGGVWEPSIYHDANRLGELGQLFNWTFTYRLDSDIYEPYGYFSKLDKQRSIHEIGLPERKTLRSKKMAASLISNCGAHSKRDAVIRTMREKIQVDSYGRCGSPAPKEGRDHLAKHYKFFLAFENSLCQDYITEKFFDAFRVGLVPVTFGLGDYAEVAPPHSYINSLDFPSISALTEYLQYLSDNDDEYLKYFHWKKDFELGPKAFANTICKICIKLWREPQNYTQQVTNFNDWWNHKRQVEFSETSGQNLTLGAKLLRDSKTACISPSEIFKQGWLK